MRVTNKNIFIKKIKIKIKDTYMCEKSKTYTIFSQKIIVSKFLLVLI